MLRDPRIGQSPDIALVTDRKDHDAAWTGSAVQAGGPQDSHGGMVAFEYSRAIALQRGRFSSS